MLSSRTLFCLCLVPSLSSIAQDTRKAPSADAFRSEALVFEHYDTTYRMHADGTGDRDLHVVMRIQSQGAAQRFGVLSFPFASANETPQIKLIRVQKADGTTVDTPSDAAIDMPSEVTREAPLYSDLKERHVPVRSLSAGDTLEYEVDTHIDKAQAPGQFWGAHHFTPPGTLIVLAENLTLEIPAEKYVQVWSPNHKAEITEKNGLRTYSWSLSQLVTAPKETNDEAPKTPKAQDPDEDDEGRKLPSVAWTTFHNWAEVGNWYRSLAQPRVKPTDALRARAVELTKGSASPEDQVQAIYKYVSTQNRYVGIDFGIGRYQPHLAEEVLANQYGDCKDKDTLLEALLQAKGFTTAPALIGAGIAPVADVPSPAVFNHVITTVDLPGGRIWLDSTPPAAPYRYLSAVIRDQKALIVPAASAAALESTPADPPYQFSVNFDADGTLDADGKLTAKMKAVYRDDDEVGVRVIARSAAPADRDKVSHYLSSYAGFSGTTSNTAFSNADDATQPIIMTYDYAKHPFGDWDNLRVVPLLPAIEFTSLGSEKNPPEEDILLGAPRTLTAISHIHLPVGFRTDLPDPIHVRTDFATFDKTYRFENSEIIAERKIAILKRKVAKNDWKKYQEFTKNIHMESEPWIQLFRPAKPNTIVTSEGSKSKSENADSKSVVKAVPAKTAKSADEASKVPTSEASVPNLMNQAVEDVKKGDWDRARDALNEIEKKDPKAKGLWSELGWVAQISDHNLDEAKTDYRKELANHPDDEWTVNALTQIESQTGESSAARKTVQKFLDLHPENVRMAMYLAALKSAANDDEGALKTLEGASAQSPENHAIPVMMGNILIRLNRNEEAAAAARTALEGADDPGLLNDAAYILSQSGVGLSTAEEASRKSIAKLEEDSASITTAEANSRAFGRANLLIAAWDTLGWTLYREGKTDEAERMLSAAWRASLRSEIGDHLAQLYEAAGQKQRAYDLYILSQAALQKSTPTDVKTHIGESVGRLRPTGEKQSPFPRTEALQALRTYKIKKPADIGGWGTFRIVITANGVIESQQMSGVLKLEALKPEIGAMKFPELLPPGSKAHLLRSAVVSCSGSNCEIVLVPDGGLQTEQ
jgi:tetratricopeptide (TPR) repeat protein/transglutaminase-like putative cysteine protease